LYKHAAHCYDKPTTKMSKYALTFWNEMEKNQTFWTMLSLLICHKYPRTTQKT